MEKYENKSFSINDLSVSKTEDGNLCLNIKITEGLISEILKNTTSQTNMGKIKFNLTDRELEVLMKLYEGKPNNKIAEELSVTSHTIKAHVSNILRKLSVNSRMQAVTKALNENILIK